MHIELCTKPFLPFVVNNVIQQMQACDNIEVLLERGPPLLTWEFLQLFRPHGCDLNTWCVILFKDDTLAKVSSIATFLQSDEVSQCAKTSPWANVFKELTALGNQLASFKIQGLEQLQNHPSSSLRDEFGNHKNYCPARVDDITDWINSVFAHVRK